MTPEAARLLDASRERLTDASAILGMGIYYIAAREAYLAAYGAAEALLLERTGRIAKTHRGLRWSFPALLPTGLIWLGHAPLRLKLASVMHVPQRRCPHPSELDHSKSRRVLRGAPWYLQLLWPSLHQPRPWQKRLSRATGDDSRFQA